ncbi:L-Ala-D/L-Glu epimerase [Microbulbifer hydrolyticus]|uniref:Dipeptide epimerase n=1 Tax=Microbulbifer hydrolyticus TaxID=48074 RepID=A0A6P1T9M4_9GAMM|nr:L-Ala-D/L-Glu epimerase [Microbulbifer hydrolyticus]MBB5209988.1 L-alanine-DL-glutamate epimerase-like enolase superfamily enzyme [Microbulbifer hydrolyticus]QHQ39484.1 L-Ala-D/L-Glu epimerase [Microbulbifer hydrolyticus]
MFEGRCYAESWPLRTAFVISRGVRTEARVVVAEVSADGVTGAGECTPYPRYGESIESVLAEITSVLPALRQGMTRAQLQEVMPAGAARNAVDCALEDWERRVSGQSHDGPAWLPTVQTLVIDEPEEMAQAARAAADTGVSVLKLKLNREQVLECVSAVRGAAPECQLVIDANESWAIDGLPDLCEELAVRGVAMLEQPLPTAEDSFLGKFQHPLPICADESCHTRADLPRLKPLYDMVNIKLDKAGGIREALALADAARTQGFEVMLGCMLCTSRAVRAAWPLGKLARFVDLDGPTWLAKDLNPLRFADGRVYWT